MEGMNRAQGSNGNARILELVTSEKLWGGKIEQPFLVLIHQSPPLFRGGPILSRYPDGRLETRSRAFSESTRSALRSDSSISCRVSGLSSACRSRARAT